MLSTNVLCMKKRKKRSYYISEASDYIPRPTKDKRSVVDNTLAMMQITEDTPPDMLAGAMDLTVHLPTGRTVKMSVERSTPMMDLLVQITTAHHLQHSGHILQALEMAPTSGHTDKVLPYKPNTPIGALDTQHVKVIPKNRSVPVPKPASVGHQPFESTFRLQVHLPRNQLYVIRVSQNVFLGDIMKKVCDEKILDPVKYEFRHPGNLDEVLDPKLTLSDYQITEVYIVTKGTVGLAQAFSSSDIMVLRKEEERKQLHARTGGGVFSLIFKRGKTSMGSGSLSSENRSISPSHSDDSRSVTPPAIQQQIIPQEPPQEKPRPPLRKRRPAPKPPSQNADNRKDSTEKPPSQISNVSDSNTSDLQQKKIDNGLTICHSRNSSDSSGYHEPSVLSDHCNTSLPRRPKSTIINEVVNEEAAENKSNGNLTKMAAFSKSTTSITSRKKKAAPPPPSVVKPEATTNSEKASPVVASPLVEVEASPKPTPRKRVALPIPTPRVKPVVVENPVPQERKAAANAEESQEVRAGDINLNPYNSSTPAEPAGSINSTLIEPKEDPELISSVNLALAEACKSPQDHQPDTSRKPEIVAIIPKIDTSSVSSFDSFGRKSGFRIGSSLVQENDNMSTSSFNMHMEPDSLSVSSKNSNTPINDDDMTDVDMNMFDTVSKNSEGSEKALRELHGIHDLDTPQEISKNRSLSSLRSSESMPSFLECKIKKWENLQELDHISVVSDGFGTGGWVVGDTSDTDSISTAHTRESPRGSVSSTKFSSLPYFKTEPLTNGTSSRNSPRGSIGSSKEETVNLPSNESSRGTEKNSSKRPSDPEIIPSKDSPRESIASSKRSSYQESVCLRKEVNGNSEVPAKDSPRESITSSKRSSFQESVCSRKEVNGSSMNSSKSSSRKESFQTETVAVIEAVPKSHMNGFASPNKMQNLKMQVDGPLKPDNLEVFVELESDWQYQLPSPPTAFRDSSPTNLTDVTNYDTITLPDFKADSVVTSPELFEKLQVVKESQTDSETISDMNSVTSEEDKTMLSKLTLENLEKRKSLVYNRELSTSLKVAQDSSSVSNRNIDEASSKRSSVLSELEEVIQNGGTKLSRANSCLTEKNTKPVVESHLPNFKISTYDKPKSKINIFEDDTIRSNDNSIKATSFVDLPSKNSSASQLNGHSTDNLYRKNSIENHSDDVFKKPQEFPKFKMNTRSNFYVKQPDNNMTRSESFSTKFHPPIWKPHNPVQRSKSQVALNKYKGAPENDVEDDDGLSRSNSLFDVSGLQSLEVMRMIQTKLNTPTNSTEVINAEGKEENIFKHTSPRNSIEINQFNSKISEMAYRHANGRNSIDEKKENGLESSSKQSSSRNSIDEGVFKTARNSISGESYKSISRNSVTELTDSKAFTPRNSISLDSSSIPPKEPESTKTYRYQGPPAINLSTWSERPRTKVSLKEDTDYKIKEGSANKVNVEIKHKQEERSNVSIKVNGTESIMSQESGNVVIKIGEPARSKPIDSFAARFINHTTASGYRKPLGNVNKLDKAPRPHSVAFDSDFDISRVPIVRAVELKKPFKEGSTSITQINGEAKYSDIYRSSEAINEINGLKQKNSSVYLNSDSANKPVLRVNSFAQNRQAPTVVGFRGPEVVNENTAKNKKSWSVNTYGTLPAKVAPEPTTRNFIPNSNVPFSHVTLRRIETNKVPQAENGDKPFGKVVLRSTGKVNRPPSITNGNSAHIPPPPPLMPKVTSFTKKVKNPDPSVDVRDELLSSIRNFGGLKGLRHAKA